MQPKVDLYDHAYANYASGAYRDVRLETYGEDFGQTSWVTTEESNEIPVMLELSSDSYVLEIGCGSGEYALHVAANTGCRLLGLDINAAGVHNANRLAAEKDLSARVRFEQSDVAKALPFGGNTFDAVFANDVLCHIRGRSGVLKEIFRVLKPRGRMLFSDALVIGGMVSHEDIAARSSIGYYVYSPPGENERLIASAGFERARVIDTTANAALIADRWRRAREKRKSDLVAAEGESNFEGLQRFLASVHALTDEKRLLRFVYIAYKPA